MARKFTFMLIPHRGGDTKQTMLSLWQLLLTAAAAALLAALVISSLIYSGYLRLETRGLNARLEREAVLARQRLEASQQSYADLTSENEALEEELESWQREVTQLQTQAAMALDALEELEMREAEIYSVLGMKNAVGGEGEPVTVTYGDTAEIFAYITARANDAIEGLSEEETSYAIEYVLDNIPDGWPLKESGEVTSEFGTRINPITHSGYEKHSGIDIAAGHREHILAAGAGTVIFTGENDVYGNFLRIDHGNG